MAQLTPRQQAARGRIETLIRLAQPALDAVLAAGDRLSRTVERGELEAPLARPLTTGAAQQGHALPRGTGSADQT
jgi:hypothetical protein